MKFLLSIFVAFLLLPYLLNAQELRVGIKEILEFEVLGLNYKSSLEPGEPFKLGFELFNSGSVGYTARVRLDIYNGTDLYYTGWSRKEPLWPNSRRYFEVYWYPINVTEKLTAKVRIYYANEIKELKPLKFKVKGMITPEQNLEITDFRTYEDRVKIEISSKQQLKDIVIIPSGYPMGWIFEQAKIDEIKANERKKVELYYLPSIWEPIEISIDVITEDGKNHMSKSFLLERETGFLSYISRLMRSLFSRFKLPAF